MAEPKYSHTSALCANSLKFSALGNDKIWSTSSVCCSDLLSPFTQYLYLEGWPVSMGPLVLWPPAGLSQWDQRDCGKVGRSFPTGSLWMPLNLSSSDGPLHQLSGLGMPMAPYSSSSILHGPLWFFYTSVYLCQQPFYESLLKLPKLSIPSVSSRTLD